MHCKDFNLYEKLIEHKASVAVLGLGYVGFPLAIEFAKRFRTIGYDISSERIEELRGTFEEAIDITFTSNVADISDASLYVISVPTPVDENKNPDLINYLNQVPLLENVLAPGILSYMNLLFILDVLRINAYLYWKRSQALFVVMTLK